MEDTIVFWKEIPTGTTPKIEIVNTELIKFLETLGYRKYVKETSFELVKIIDSSVVRPVEVFMIRDEVKECLLRIQREDVWEEFLKTDYLQKRITESLEKISIDFNYGDDDNAVFFYLNGALKVSKDTITIIPYDEFEGYVWENQIVKRSFSETNSHNIEFRTFCWHLCNHDEDRFKSLRSILGYLLHSYKDPSLTKAIVFIDEIIDVESDRSEGGTGKSLLADSLSKIIPSLRKNGKNLKSSDKFFFADVESYHRIIVFDDVKKDFDFESLYSMITGDMPLEKKYKNPTIISFKDVPKVVLITSNYIVKGTGGNSERRRKSEFEVSDYYRENPSIIEEFGHRFFDDWDDNEWNLFDNYMIENVQLFLEEGIIESTPINLLQNRLVLETCTEFAVFIEEAILNPTEFGGSIEADSVTFNKGAFFRKFITDNTEIKSNPIQLKKWLDIYADCKGYSISHRKSNGQSLVVIGALTNQQQNIAA